MPVLQTLYEANTAPVEGLMAAKKSRFSNEDTIRQILEKQPETLKLFGHDPEKVK